MKSFAARLPAKQDATGKLVPGPEIVFELIFSVAFFRRIRSLLGIDMLTPAQQAPDQSRSAVETVMWDLETFVNVTYLACQSQADAAGITDEEFGLMLDDPTFLACRKAVFEEWEDFFERAGVTAAAAVLRKQREIFALAGSRVDQIPAETFMKGVDKQLQSLIAGL